MKPYITPAIKKDFPYKNLSKNLTFAVLKQVNEFTGNGGDVGGTIMFKCGANGCEVGKVGN